jgi:hypothetical protein
MKKWVNSVGIMLFAVLSIPVYALKNTTEDETFSQEAPIIKGILLEASALDRDEYDNKSTWKAANLYCKASRYGSAEGMCRLGMLYAFSNDVKKSKITRQTYLA